VAFSVVTYYIPWWSNLLIAFICVGIVIAQFLKTKVRLLPDKLLLTNGEGVPWNQICRAKILPFCYADTMLLRLYVETDYRTNEQKLIGWHECFNFARKTGLNKWVIKGPIISLFKGDVSKFQIIYDATFHPFWRRFWWWRAWVGLPFCVPSLFFTHTLIGVMLFFSYLFVVTLTSLIVIESRHDVAQINRKLIINDTSIVYQEGNIPLIISLDQIQSIERRFISGDYLNLTSGKTVKLPANYLFLTKILIHLIAQNP
jgi:hypothetical protein